MDQASLFQLHKNRIINCAIGPSSMRGQGAKNSIQTFREALYTLDFHEFKASLNESYPN